MARNNTSSRWFHWSVIAPERKLMEMLSALDAGLPEGWQDCTEREKAYAGADCVRVYTLSPSVGWAGANLAVSLLQQQELRGGKVEAVTAPGQTAPFPGHEVDRFLDDGLLRAAKRVGLAVKKGTVADIFFDDLPWEAQQSLSVFNNTSRKTVPLNRAESAAWQAFVIVAYRGPDSVSYEPLTEWLAAQGWPQPAATELTARLFDQFQLLSRYRETMVVA